MAKEFTSLLKPKSAPFSERFDGLGFFFKDAFSIQTLFAIGAVVQIGLFCLLPRNLAVLPAALLSGYAGLSTVVEMTSKSRNSFMSDVLPGRTSAQLPRRHDGKFGADPAAQDVVVFHFGVRFNHPLGMAAPGASDIGGHFQKCNKAVRAQAEDFGLLGMSTWRAGERASNNTLMLVMYFRDVEGLNRFAHSPIHRQAWDWANKFNPEHIGFFHEAFCVPRKAYETIYVNMNPMLMGATSVKCDDGAEEKQWVNTLVDADVGPLRSQFGRMGRGFQEHQEFV